MKHCPACLAEAPDAARFCTRCATALVDGPVPKPGRKTRPTLIILAVAGVAIASGGLAVWRSGPARSAAGLAPDGSRVRLEVSTLHRFRGNVYGVAATPEFLAADVVGMDMGVQIVDRRSGQVMRQLPGGRPLALSPGNLLAVATSDGIGLWNVVTGERLFTYREASVADMFFTSEGMRLFGRTAGGGIWDHPMDGDDTGRFEPTPFERAALDHKEGEVISPASGVRAHIGPYGPEGPDGHCTVSFFDARGTSLGKVDGPPGFLVTAQTFSLDGKTLLLGGNDGRLVGVSLLR